jgi:hypothetical protein
MPRCVPGLDLACFAGSLAIPFGGGILSGRFQAPRLALRI